MHLEQLNLEWSSGEVDDGLRTTSFYYRNPIDCVRYLLRQIIYDGEMVYAPVKEFNSDGERTYSEMHTGDWWWETQVSTLHHLI